MAKLLDHEIDGIQEYDNPAPPWLMFILYSSIVFGIGYAIYYPSFWFWPGISGWSSGGQYTAQMEDAEKRYAGMKAAVVEVALTPDDSTVIALGEKQFKARCAPCHGSTGEGKVGPSFLDDKWLYGGADNDIVTSVREGRPKGMPPWGKVLKPEELTAVASYVRRINNEALAGK